MSKILSANFQHIIWRTKSCESLIMPQDLDKVFSYIAGICSKLDCKPLAVDGAPDHVHIVCQLKASVSVSQLMAKVKGSSSYWIKSLGEHYSNFYWQNSYAHYSISLSVLPKVISYVKNQRIHHQVKSFDEEYDAFLLRWQKQKEHLSI